MMSSCLVVRFVWLGVVPPGGSRLSAGAGSSCTYAGPGITPGTAERGSSGGLVGMFGTFPSAGSDLWIRPLLEETALPSLRTKLFVRSPRRVAAGLDAKSLRRSGEMALHHPFYSLSRGLSTGLRARRGPRKHLAGHVRLDVIGGQKAVTAAECSRARRTPSESRLLDESSLDRK